MTLLELSLFYKNLAELYSAGISFNSAFSTLQSSEKNIQRRAELKFISDQISKGKPLADSFQRVGLVPTADIAVLRSGEKAGSLQLVFENLSAHYSQSAQAEKNIRSGLMKPFFILAAALFVPSFPDLFLGKISLARYCWQNFGVLAAILLLAFLIHQVYMRSQYDLHLARTRHRVLSALPFLRGLNKKIALEKFVSGLSMMLESGLQISDALLEAGRCSADTELAGAAARIAQRIHAGTPLPQSFQAESVFPAEIQNNILLGTESGKIPAFLKRSGTKLKNEITETVERFSKALPVIVYWIVTLYVAWTIIGFYRGHLKDLDNALNNS